MFKLAHYLRICSTAAIAVLSTCNVFAQDKVDRADKLESTVLQYIVDFENPSATKRDIAERMLIGLGPQILPTIRAIYEENRLQGESALRFSRVFQAVQRAELESQLATSTVTIQGEKTLSEIFELIEQQTGNKLQSQVEPSGPFLLDFAATPFWQAIDELTDSADMDIQPYGSSGSLTLVPTQEINSFRQRRGQYSGAFRIEPVSIVATRSFRNDAIDSLQIGLEIAWEPRLQPLLFDIDRDSLLGECDNGALIESARTYSQEVSPNQSSQVEFDLALQRPPRDATEISRLSGKITAKVPGMPVPVAFKDLDQQLPIERRIGDIIATVERLRQNGEITQIDLLLKLNASNMRLDSFRNWLLVNEAYALDPSGQKIQNLGWQTYLMNESEVGITVNFQLEGSIAGHQFIFSAPAALIDHKIDFILENIPLP